MCCRPRPCSRPGLLSCLACQRGLPFSSRRAGLILAHSPSLSTSCCLRRSPSFLSPLPLRFLPSGSRFVGLPILTPVSLALSATPFALLLVNSAPSSLTCLFPRTRSAGDSTVSLRDLGGPRRCPVHSVPQVSGSFGYSLSSWPISLSAHGMPSPHSVSFSVGVRLLPVLCLHPPPSPPLPSVHSRIVRHPTPLPSCWVYSL